MFFLGVLFIVILFLLMPYLIRNRSNVGAEELEKCRRQAHMFFENPFERLLAPNFQVEKLNARTYYVRAYYHFGIPYDGALIHDVHPYFKSQEGAYVEDQWNCEGSMTRIGFRAATPTP